MQETIDVADSEPSKFGVVRIEAVARAELLRLPKLQTIVLPRTASEPWETLAERMVKLAGRKFVTVTPLAKLGPLLVTETL